MATTTTVPSVTRNEATAQIAKNIAEMTDLDMKSDWDRGYTHGYALGFRHSATTSPTRSNLEDLNFEDQWNHGYKKGYTFGLSEGEKFAAESNSVANA